MKLLVLIENRYRVKRDLGGISCFQNKICMRIKKKLAGWASEQGSGYDRVRIGEGVFGIKLPLKIILASWTREPAVELVKSLGFRSQNILVPFNSLKDLFRVHFLEDAHITTLNMIGL